MTSSVGIPDSSMLCSNLPFKMATYCSASILPSTSVKTPTPFHPIQPPYHYSHPLALEPHNAVVYPRTIRPVDGDNWPTNTGRLIVGRRRIIHCVLRVGPHCKIGRGLRVGCELAASIAHGWADG